MNKAHAQDMISGPGKPLPSRFGTSARQRKKLQDEGEPKRDTSAPVCIQLTAERDQQIQLRVAQLRFRGRDRLSGILLREGSSVQGGDPGILHDSSGGRSETLPDVSIWLRQAKS